MAKKRKYYVVWEGQTPGIYNTWAECQLQVKAYPNAKFKSYSSLTEAEEAYAAGYSAPPRSQKQKTAVVADHSDIDLKSISVDAACSGNPGDMEYRGVWTEDSAELFRQGPYAQGTNNVGEFLAIVHALALLENKGDPDTRIYTDSRTAMGWVRKKKANTQLKRTNINASLFQLIARAENWLKTHPVKNPITKWETSQWGEIPADFGRK